MVEVRAYETADVAAMVDVWNEVVRDGIAFPQEDELDETTGSICSRPHAWMSSSMGTSVRPRSVSAWCQG